MKDYSFTVKRVGECLRCGNCCLDCRHFEIADKSCLIYDTRTDYCKECGRTHAKCINYPYRPNGEHCGYSFIEEKTEQKIKGILYY